MRIQRKTHSRLWVYLLYLGLVTSLILSVTLARYTSSAQGTGAATVAALAGGGTLSAGSIEMPLTDLFPGGEPKALDFQVINYTGGVVSEVAMDYTIKVETTGNLPLRFTLTADPGENRVGGGEILKGRMEETLTGGFFPLTGEKQVHKYTLTAQWPAGESDAGYANEVDLVTVTVEARQRLSGEGPAGG